MKMSACAEPPFFCESRLLQDANRFEQRRRRSNHCSSFRAGFGGLLSFAIPRLTVRSRRFRSFASPPSERWWFDPYYTFTIAGARRLTSQAGRPGAGQ